MFKSIETLSARPAIYAVATIGVVATGAYAGAGLKTTQQIKRVCLRVLLSFLLFSSLFSSLLAFPIPIPFPLTFPSPFHSLRPSARMCAYPILLS